ncbi:unnamed protein product [Citrullus colocynthis]|uniref:Uncharacterized protein n=1 Tax=Citrullus colocynthis TaxID=252529 RepID=A0ABP0YGH1_9ROSI
MSHLPWHPAVVCQQSLFGQSFEITSSSVSSDRRHPRATTSRSPTSPSARSFSDFSLSPLDLQCLPVTPLLPLSPRSQTRNKATVHPSVWQLTRLSAGHRANLCIRHQVLSCTPPTDVLYTVQRSVAWGRIDLGIRSGFESSLGAIQDFVRD